MTHHKQSKRTPGIPRPDQNSTTRRKTQIAPKRKFQSDLWTPKTLKQKSSKEPPDNETPTRTQHHEAKAPSPDKKDRRRAHRNHTQESLDSTHKCRVESPAKCARRAGHSNISSEIFTACGPQQHFASPGSGVTRPNSPVREAARFCWSFY